MDQKLPELELVEVTDPTHFHKALYVNGTLATEMDYIEVGDLPGILNRLFPDGRVIKKVEWCEVEPLDLEPYPEKLSDLKVVTRREDSR